MDSKREINTVFIYKSAKEFFLFTIRKWVLIGLIIFIAGLAGAVHYWLKDPQYVANLTFALEESSNDVGGYANIAAQLGFNIGGGSSSGAFKGDNLIELMKSRYILEKTLLSEVKIKGEKKLLINYYLDITKKGERYVKRGFLPKYYYDSDKNSYTLQQDSILYRCQKDISNQLLSVSRIDKKLSIISVSVQSLDQHFAIAFCKELVDILTNFYIETVTKKDSKNVAVLQTHADSLRRLMSGSLAEVAIANDLNINPMRQVQKLTSQRGQIDANVYSMAYGEILKNLELARIALQRETPLIQLIDEPTLPLENNKKGRLYGLIVGVSIASIFLLPLLILLYKIEADKKKIAYS